jgi:hypothetical protein
MFLGGMYEQTFKTFIKASPYNLLMNYWGFQTDNFRSTNPGCTLFYSELREPQRAVSTIDRRIFYLLHLLNPL